MLYQPLYALRVVADPLLSVTDRFQFRKPRSKRARIQKKWARRPENFRKVETDQCFQVGNLLVCSPSIVDRVRREVTRNIEREMIGAPITATPINIQKSE